MLNFEAIQEIAQTAHNTTHNGVAYREISTEDVRDALLGEACEFIAAKAPNADAKVPQLITHQLATQATDAGDFGAFLESKILDMIERFNAGRQSDGDMNTLHATAQGLGNFIKRVQSAAGRSSYFRKLEALKREQAGADKKVSYNDYDGFQNVIWQPEQVDEAIDEIFESLQQAFGYVLPMCAKKLQSGGYATFAFSSVKDDRTGNYEDYMSRIELYNELDNKRTTYEVDAKAALAMLA